MERHARSWGRIDFGPQRELGQWHRSDPLPALEAGETMLPRGCGRSYGDSCMNAGGAVVNARGMDRFIAFDAQRGVLVCEAGVTLGEILDCTLPQGWRLPVVPGTRFVTVGGAIANDVHGKNHHHAGTFGRHVRRFELLRSDGSRRICAPGENADWFAATIGGLGLTGMVTWAELALVPVDGDALEQELIRFDRVADFFALADESDARFDYTVAWVDCLARGDGLGRGIFMRANHAPSRERPAGKVKRAHLGVPFPPPLSLVNLPSIALFNALYYRRVGARPARSVVSMDRFFFPLDAIADWNRIYGPRGFYQYQCVLPPGQAEDGVRAMLQLISASRTGSFLSVLKRFGPLASPGLLSFPRPGVTLALDFPNRGQPTLDLLERLDGVTRAAGGAVYPAKDGRMSPASFRAYFPHWEALVPFQDPQFSSSFWRRVTALPQ